MKTILLGVAVAILGMATNPISAQTQSTSTTTTTNYIQTSKLIGTKVQATGGTEVGTIKDVVLDQNGCMAYTVVSTGGTSSRLTGSAKTVAVPWSVYQTTSDPRVVTVRVEKEKIYNAPVFDYARIQEYSTGGYINNVYSYYGVAPGVGVSTSVGGGVSGSTYNSGTATTNTNATTQGAAATASPGAAATASPGAMATASPAPSATATPLGSPVQSATPTSTENASATPAESASASPSRSTSKSKSSASATPHHKSSSSSSNEGSSTKTRRQSSEGSSKSEPSDTPKKDGDE